MRKFLVLAVAVVVCWWLLPWGDDPFACGAVGVAEESGGECPADLKAAAEDQQWAEQRIASIIDKKRTTGLFFWGNGNKSFVSGEDEHAERATDAMKDAGVPFPERGPHPAAAHVETKIAAWMVAEDISHGLVVINNERGPCGADGQGPFTCGVAVRAILPKGSSLAVWFPGAIESVLLEGEGG